MPREAHDEPLYFSEGQRLTIEFASRGDEFRILSFQRSLLQAGLNVEFLINNAEYEMHVGKACATSALINLQACLTIARALKQFKADIEVGERNRRAMALRSQSADFDSLVTILRNALAHPLDGEGRPHPNTAYDGASSYSFYMLRGEDFTITYPNLPYRLADDVSFGAGVFRLSVFAHILPVLIQLRDAVLGEFEKLNPPDQRKMLVELVPARINPKWPKSEISEWVYKIDASTLTAKRAPN